MQRILIFLSIVLVVAYTSCKKPDEKQAPPVVDCNNIDSRFSARVSPIIENTCAANLACHATGSVNGPGALTNFLQISNAAVAIKNAVNSGAMPIGSTLSSDVKNIINCWVNSGAPNN